VKICFVADARSPIACNWISHFVESGYRVHVISSYPCSPDAIPGATIHSIPIAFGRFARQPAHEVNPDGRASAHLVSRRTQIRGSSLHTILTSARHWLTPVELYAHTRTARELLQEIRPDLVHALRIPYEGVFAAMVVQDQPLLVSVWGNDFTMCAEEYPLMGRLTRRMMTRVDGLIADCERDRNLAPQWGFDRARPSVVLPGAGGVKREIFHAGPPSVGVFPGVTIPSGARVVLNPRGMRGYVRTESYFRSIQIVLETYPAAMFLCLAMEGNAVAERWIRDLHIENSVRLLPSVPYARMGDVFRLAEIAVSPSVHDGTPNTLLEGMACGCFPVTGDIESVREWIVDGENGFLCDPNDERSLAGAIIRALQDAPLRDRARDRNHALVERRASYATVMQRAQEFYARVMSESHSMRQTDQA
jgi:glycosyltransferase involved in cell wall biosynthesis